MARIWSTRWKLRSATSVALLAAVVVAAVLGNASAQERDTGVRKTTWAMAGFVRPGDGAKVESGADGLASTIYYAVYQYDGSNPADPYNTGLGDLAAQFVPGAGVSKSPAFPAGPGAPKYLYLYQIVNDRGLDTQSSKDGIRLASNTEVKSKEIGSVLLKLPVDSSAIQSWGYFKNAGFAINALDRGATGIRPTAVPPQTHIAVSANPSVLSKLRSITGQNYARMASPVAFNPSSGFTLEKSGKNLQNSLFHEELRGKKGETLVAWEKEAKKAAESGGDTPDAVDLMKFAPAGDAKAETVLRALFASHPLMPGANSVVLGFASNMAPGNDMVRIQDSTSAKKNTGIRTVSTDDIDFGAAGFLPLPKEPAPAVAEKTAPIGGLGGLRPSQLVVHGLVSPGDIPSGSRLLDKGVFKTLGGTVYFAVFRRTGNTTTAGDTWGVGRSDFDSMFVPGESYRASFSPKLDTDAEYLYLYEVVNDRGLHDLTLPQNKNPNLPVAATPEAMPDRAAITREVASFSLFLRADPRLITSWGYFDESGFNIKVPSHSELKQAANDPAIKPAGIPMAVSSNLSVLDTLFPYKDKEYRAWAPPVQVDFNRTTLNVGKDTKNINENRLAGITGARGGAAIRFAALRTLDRVVTEGGNKPDYVQLIYFDKNSHVNGATVDGITLGPAEVARAVFKAEWLAKPITEGHHSVVFGFTSNAEPVRAPVRLKDLNQTVNNSSLNQERVFLGPERIRQVALDAAGVRAGGTAPILGRGVAAGVAPGVVPGVAPGVAQGVASGIGAGVAPATAEGIALAGIGLDGDANEVALAIGAGLGNGIVPAGLAGLVAGSAAPGVAISPSIATPGDAAVAETVTGGGAGYYGGVPLVTSNAGGGGFGGGMPMMGAVGALGTARPAVMGGGGFGGGSGGSNGSGSNTKGATGTTGTTGSGANSNADTSGQGSGQGSGTGSGTGSGQGSGTGSGTGTSASENNININFNVSQTNQQTQSQYQTQEQSQNQNQSQKQNQNQNGGNDCCNNGNVVPAPASLLLGLLGLPGLYLAYRRRQTPEASEPETEEPTA